MSQQRRKSGQAKKRKAQKTGGGMPGWVWGLGGLMIGLCVAVVVNLELKTDDEDLDSMLGAEQSNDSAQESPSQTTDNADSDQGAANKDRSKEPDFEFYKVLPEQEVEVPAEEQAKADEATSPDTPAGDGAVEPATSTDEASAAASPADDAAAKGGSGSLVLQAGSFQDPGSADRMKAELALLGIEARIESASPNGEETWHRVRAGPYTDRKRVNEIRDRLRRNDIDTIILTKGD